MEHEIKLTWLGHSCFKIESSGYSAVLDPYEDQSVPGFPALRTEANAVYCSHSHHDHDFRDGVRLTAASCSNPFRITEITCPHDDAGGSKRGMNTIRIFDEGTLRVAHFGDIGCPLPAEDLKQLTGLDAVMIPVGGFFTMEPAGIAALLQKIQPRVVIPMHYRSDTFGYDKIGRLEAFLAYCTNVRYYDTDEITITKALEAQAAVLAFQPRQ